MLDEREGAPLANEPRQPKPINLDELIARRLPEDITYAEYRDAAKDPNHPLHDPDNPRHESYKQARETFNQSEKTTSEAIKKMVSGEWLGAEHKRAMEETEKLVKLPVEPLDDLFRPQASQVNTSFLTQDYMADFDYDDTFMGRMEKAQEAAAVNRVEREKRDAERHEELRDILLTLSASAVDQRDELTKMREGQEAESERQITDSTWQKSAATKNFVVATATLAATLVGIAVSIFLAVWLN